MPSLAIPGHHELQVVGSSREGNGGFLWRGWSHCFSSMYLQISSLVSAVSSGVKHSTTANPYFSKNALYSSTWSFLKLTTYPSSSKKSSASKLESLTPFRNDGIHPFCPISSVSFDDDPSI